MRTKNQPMVQQDKWKSQRDGFLDSLVYMQKRQKGEIKSFLTPWDKFNDAGIEGIEWNSTVIIASRPSYGKTTLKDLIIREGIRLNCTKEEIDSANFPYRVLEFNFEMHFRASAIREYSSVMGKSYKYLCSADGKLTDTDLDLCHQYAKTRVKYPINVVDEPCTVNEFREIIEEYMESFSTTVKTSEGTTKKYKNTIITIDHALLFKRASFEKDMKDVMFSLGSTVTYLKKKYPIIFLILTQLNREIESPERCVEGSIGNYATSSDIFASDALCQYADMVVGLNIPGLRHIHIFGPERFIIDDTTIMAMHFMKVRNGDPRMSFFRTEFDKMNLVEMDTPPRQIKKRI